MPPFQPEVAEDVARAVLDAHFSSPVSTPVAIEGGQIALVYAFSSGSEEFVIRFNRNNLDANFEKEGFIARRFGSPDVPIPEVIAIGRAADLHYCIARRAPGRQLRMLSPDELRGTLPSIIRTLRAIHASDVTGTSGYGLFNGHGRGFWSSWTEYLAAVRDEERDGGFFGRWHSLFDTSFLERDIFDRIYSKMERLLRFCLDDRRLVHGNFAFRNVLSVGSQVSAVLDWLDAKFGDPLYDVAGLDFWHPEYGFGDLYRAAAASSGESLQDYERRVLCCQCQIALDGFRFFALANRPEAYQWVKERILALCDATPDVPRTSGKSRVETPMDEPIPEWSTTTALVAAEEGRIEEWVHAYLTAGYWANRGLSEGLHLCRRWWRGPLLVPLTELIRVCGPEENMPFRQSVEGWEDHVGRLMQLADPLEVPPLIVEYRAGVLAVCDGSHRLEAMRRLDWRSCWVIVWYNREADFDDDCGQKQFRGLIAKLRVALIDSSSALG